MQRKLEDKWRPPLWLVIGCTIFAMLCLPVLGILFLASPAGAANLGASLRFATFGILLASFGVGWVLWRILWRPITTLAARADDIRTGKAEALAPLEHYGTSEMQAMATAMLHMGQVLKDRETVVRSYADHVTHELKSPLSVLQGAAELLADPDLSDADRTKMVANVTKATQRMRDLLDAQRDLARANEPLPDGTCRLSDVLRPTSFVTISNDGTLPISAEAFEPVATHLINNAKAHGASTINFEFRDDRLIVADNGPGISQGNRDRVFEPFFTTRRDDGGTGMGLSIVRRILDTQGARIRLLEGDGATFEIAF